MFSGVSAFMMAITVGILLPSISEELGLSPTEQGVFGSSAFLGNLLLALPLSWWTSQFRPKTLTTATLALGAAMLALQGLAPNFATLLAGRLAFGLTTLAREPARALLMHQWFRPPEFITVNSVYNALFGIVVGAGLAATPFALGALGDDWRIVLLAFVGGTLFLMAAWTLVGREREGAREATRREGGQLDLIRRALRHKDLWIAGMGFMGATMAWSSFLNFYPTLMLETRDLSLSWTGGILAVGVAMGGFCGIALSYLVGRMSQARRKLLVVAIGAAMAATYLAMLFAQSTPLLMLASAANGATWGYYPLLSSVPFYLPGIRPREVAIAVSLLMTAATAGTFVGPVVAGVLQDRTGDLRLALAAFSFTPLLLSACGMLLSIRADAAPE